VGGAAIFLFVAMAATGRRLPRGFRIWIAFAIMGLFNNVFAFTLIAWGQTTITSGLASILNATTPLFTVVIAHVFTHDDRMTPARVAGLIIGFSGVTIMIGADALGQTGGQLLAQLAVLAASISYAVSSVYGRRFGELGVRPMAAATGQLIMASVMVIPVALYFEPPWQAAMPSAATWGSLFGLAFLATFVAYMIYYRLLATAGSVNVMLVTFLVPVSAIILGAVILGERLSINHFVGMAAIGLGLAAIDGRLLMRRRRRPA
ncbi:MAG: DMT family transporter, partial [Alphaproteobacteria bacterium]